jgi:hypothetical protein
MSNQIATSRVCPACLSYDIWIDLCVTAKYSHPQPPQASEPFFTSRPPRLPPDPFEQEQTDLIRSIRSGKPINEARSAAESTLIGIMGRVSAYTGRTVTWDEVLNSKQGLAPAIRVWLTAGRTGGDSGQVQLRMIPRVLNPSVSTPSGTLADRSREPRKAASRRHIGWRGGRAPAGKLLAPPQWQLPKRESRIFRQ